MVDRELVAKTIRTIQSEMFFLKETKDAFYLWSRRLMRKPHDRDFHALRFLAGHLQGQFVDIGANQGQSIESMRLVVPDAKVISFEPNPDLIPRLQHRYKDDDGIEVRGVGLGASAGSFNLIVPRYRGYVYDGLASIDPDAALTWINSDRVFFFRPNELTHTTYECRVETLDAQKLQPCFIKIDVQGTEYGVVTGGVETIRAHQPVLMIEDLYADPRLPALFTDIGYRQFNFDGERLVPAGAPATNTFLIPESRLSALGLSS